MKRFYFYVACALCVYLLIARQWHDASAFLAAILVMLDRLEGGR